MLTLANITIILLPLYKVVGNSLVYLVCIGVASYLIFSTYNQESNNVPSKQNTLSLDIVNNDRSIQDIIVKLTAVLPSEVMYEIKSKLLDFFDNYTTLLMTEYDESIYNSTLDTQSSILNIINSFDNRLLIGEETTDTLSDTLLTIFKRYTSVIVEKYQVKNKVAVMQSNKFTSQYEYY
jgi:hypothetical protein